MEHLLNREQLELCRLLSLALHNKALERLSPDVDYARVIAVAESHKVMALLHPVLEHAGLQESIWKIVDRKGEQRISRQITILCVKAGTASRWNFICRSQSRLTARKQIVFLPIVRKNILHIAAWLTVWV